MTEDLEDRLKQALRPVAPSEEFSARLLQRLEATSQAPVPQTSVLQPAAPQSPLSQPAAPQSPLSQPAVPNRGSVRRLPTANWWLSAGLAACVLIGLGIHHRASESQERLAGLAARQQVFEALSMTNQKLDLVYRTVRNEARDER